MAFTAGQALRNRIPDINTRDDNGYSLLLDAVDSGHADIVRLVLEHHPDLNVRMKDGETALSLATKEAGIGTRTRIPEQDSARILNMLKTAGTKR